MKGNESKIHFQFIARFRISMPPKPNQTKAKAASNF